jgi:hypothetical protein
MFFRYDCEEHSTMFDGDNSVYLGDESSYKEGSADAKEAGNLLVCSTIP